MHSTFESDAHVLERRKRHRIARANDWPHALRRRHFGTDSLLEGGKLLKVGAASLLMPPPNFLAPVPEGLTDEQVLMCPDILSTGFSGAESGGIRIGDIVAAFAQGPSGSAPRPGLG